MQRREFIGAAAGTAVAVTLPAEAKSAPNAPPARPRETRRGDMLYRQLGATGQEVSALGLGGHHIGRQPDEADSIAIIRTAIDAGVTFLDNCWDYHDGLSEVRMGKALRDGYRRKAFLMTKIDGRTKKAAALQIDESLTRLRTDVIELLQFHEIIRSKTRTACSPPAARGRRSTPRRKQARSGSSGSPGTRTRSSTCACSTSPRRTG